MTVHTGIPLHHQRTNNKEEGHKEKRGEDFYLGQTVTETFQPKGQDDKDMEIFVKSANMRAL